MTLFTDHPIFQHIPYFSNAKAFQASLASFAPMPDEVRNQPKDIRRNFYLDRIEEWFHVGYDQYQIADAIQRLILKRYSRVKFESANDNANFYRSETNYKSPSVGLVVGNPGVGKSLSIHQCLRNYPQIIEIPHAHLKNPLPIVVWSSLTIQSTSPKDFAVELANHWNSLFETKYPNQPPPIAYSTIRNKSMEAILDTFFTSARNHRLGLLHTDEIQNLFAIKFLGGKPIISTRDDKTLRKVLSFFNSEFSTLISCTPDGLDGLNQRVSVSQRAGLQEFILRPFQNDKYYKKFMKELWVYQYTDIPINLDDDILELFYTKTAGYPRLILSAFIKAQANVLDIENRSSLCIDDFKEAFSSFSHDIQLTVLACLNKRDDILNTKVDFNRKL